MAHIDNKVEFTRQQIEYLESQFPEVIGNYTTTSDEFRWRAAQRSVLASIKLRAMRVPGELHGLAQ